MTARSATPPDVVRAIVAQVVDPELPVLTIEDLGILRDVSVGDDGHITVTITPTYSGCPAVEAITDDVRKILATEGFAEVSVRTVLAPAWTTDWMSDAGREKLLAYGIVPPAPLGPRQAHDHKSVRPRSSVVTVALSQRCPRCGSPDTRELSRFGSTACKSLWMCTVCKEPFDHFKAI
ncbi:MAG TPA: 1,2-phenylacetyl-CoA epoxidase subunit PaaD [Nocardioidaceae bacterium]|nr:1,2-phenylacetyl-CoA epoxidase subunit PaaD [Nocardioidaceae bacterium]